MLKLLLLLLNLNIFAHSCCKCCCHCCCGNNSNSRKSIKNDSPRKPSIDTAMTNLYDFKLTDDEEKAFMKINEINKEYKKHHKNKTDKKELDEYLNKIRETIIYDNYEIDEKINIYRKFEDNYEVKAEKCALEWNYNCWFTASLLALFSIKKFCLFLKNTNFDRNTEENRWNVLKDLFNLYENNKQLSSTIINKYRDKFAEKMFVSCERFRTYKSDYYFDYYKKWNDPNEFFRYLKIVEIFDPNTDCTIFRSITRLINNISDKKPKDDEIVYFKKEEHIKDDDNSFMADFYRTILDDKIKFKLIYNKEKECYWVEEMPLSDKIYYNTDVYLFTNGEECESFVDLYDIINNEKTKKKYKPCVLILAAPRYHIMALIKDNDGNWRLYDGLTRTNGKIINLKEEFGNKMYFNFNGHKYYISYCFAEVIIED